MTAPTSDNGWLALDGALLAVIGIAMAVAEWTRRHPNRQEPTDKQLATRRRAGVAGRSSRAADAAGPAAAPRR